MNAAELAAFTVEWRAASPAVAKVSSGGARRVYADDERDAAHRGRIFIARDLRVPESGVLIVSVTRLETVAGP